MLRTLVNVEPTNEFRSMEEVFERFFGQPSRPVPAATVLPIDVSEKEGSLWIRAAAPGVDPNDLQISVENNVLTIRGETKTEIDSEKEKIYRREVSYGAFSRSIRLPEKLDLEHVEAGFNHGMVSIKIPRLPEAKPQVLKISVKDLNAPQNSETEAN